MAHNYFYNGQVEKYLTQFIRLLSNFSVEFGTDRDGNKTLQRVPVIYGDSSRQAASIIKQGSENMLNTVPCMAVYIEDITYDRTRVQNPTYTDKIHLRERRYDPETGQYGHEMGNAVTVERLMPVPYTLKLKVDVWTSNARQRLQLMEQIAPLFNPAFEIQANDNYVDWTSLTYVMIESNIYNSRPVPAGGDTSLEITTWAFTIPIWLSTPALVRKMGVIQKIVASVFEDSGEIAEGITDFTNILSRQYLTPLNYGVILVGNQLSLIGQNQSTSSALGAQVFKTVDADVVNATSIQLVNTEGVEVGQRVSGGDCPADTTVLAVNGSVVTVQYPVNFYEGDKAAFTSVPRVIDNSGKKAWEALYNLYGKVVANGTSQVKLELADGNEVVGTVAAHPNNDNILLFSVDVDTVPTNTLPAVAAIIDPTRARPGADLEAAAAGTRYLLARGYNDTTDEPPVYNWRGVDGELLVAKANDIIQYDATSSFWYVAFDSATATGVEYVTNATTLAQYRFADGAWAKSYEGTYNSGEWSLIL